MKRVYLGFIILAVMLFALEANSTKINVKLEMKGTSVSGLRVVKDYSDFYNSIVLEGKGNKLHATFDIDEEGLELSNFENSFTIPLKVDVYGKEYLIKDIKSADLFIILEEGEYGAPGVGHFEWENVILKKEQAEENFRNVFPFPGEDAINSIKYYIALMA